ncbi:hypothetical protein PISMIDRAFT_678358, partial [Pisolithus microcarpus 441]
MLSFGIPRRDLAELLGSFLDDVRDGMLSDEHRLAELGFGRFMLSPAEMSSGRRVDQITDLSFPADLFPVARSMRRRSSCLWALPIVAKYTWLYAHLQLQSQIVPLDMFAEGHAEPNATIHTDI